MKMWIDKQFHDWEEETIKIYSNFLDSTLMETDGKTLSEQLKTSLLRQIEGITKVFEKVFDKDPPSPIYPKMGWKLIELDKLEFARQITIYDSQMYSKIQPKEYLNKAFQSNDKQTLAPNVHNFINRFNIVRQKKKKKVIKKKKSDQKNISNNFIEKKKKF